MVKQYVPSAGMIRIRFCGSSVTRSSQPVRQAPRCFMLLLAFCHSGKDEDILPEFGP